VHYCDRQCANYEHNINLCKATKQRLHAILLPALKRRQLGVEICELDHAQLAKVADAAQSSILIDNDGHICHVLAPEPCRHRCGAVCRYRSANLQLRILSLSERKAMCI
jgi:hypothetical protein